MVCLCQSLSLTLLVNNGGKGQFFFKGIKIFFQFGSCCSCLIMCQFLNYPIGLDWNSGYDVLIKWVFYFFCLCNRNYRNSYFGRVGGLTTDELNKLELEFLFLMGFKLHVNVSVFESYCSHLEREVSIGGGYHIEKTLRCAEEIKARHTEERGYTHIARVML